MRVLKIILVAAVASCGLRPRGLNAQEEIPVAVELRLGLTRPVQCLVACEGGDPGEGAAGWWNGSIDLKIHRDISAFAGYSQYKLQESRDYTAAGSGFDVGARLNPWARRPISPWVRAGVLLHRRHFRFRAAPQETAEVESDRGFGWELGVGLSFRLTSFLAITPGIQYERYSTKVNIDEAFQQPMGRKISYKTSYFVFDLGLRLNR